MKYIDSTQNDFQEDLGNSTPSYSLFEPSPSLPLECVLNKWVEEMQKFDS